MSTRWPVHPPPAPMESLSSWLARLADLFGMSMNRLMADGLGIEMPRTRCRPVDLDREAPEQLLTALAGHTGVPVHRLRWMTLRGWEPFLLERWRPPDGASHAGTGGTGGRSGALPCQEKVWADEVYTRYVRDCSVLFPPHLRKQHQPSNLRRKAPWPGPWNSLRHRDEVTCLQCAHLRPAPPVPALVTDRVFPVPLVWRLPIVTTCPTHGRPLVDPIDVRIASMRGKHPPARVVGEARTQLDRYTYEGLLTGWVSLPERTVHVSSWFRLLRGLLDEMVLPTAAMPRECGRVLERIWAETAHPLRADLHGWRPYELLSAERQGMLLDAAAAALDLANRGEIPARGSFGTAVAKRPPEAVHPGFRRPEPPLDWLVLSGQLAECVRNAQTSHAVAQRLLHLTMLGLADPDRAARNVAWLVAEGVPEPLLTTTYSPTHGGSPP